MNDEQFGYYLAGLIDGDGHFSKARQLVIVFSSPDAFLAYYLKEKLGFVASQNYFTCKKLSVVGQFLCTPILSKQLKVKPYLSLEKN